MTSLDFPDVNVWLAMLLADHAHRGLAINWWNATSAETIAYCRMTQISTLRVLTTAAAMNGKPLSMSGAWAAYEGLFGDDRVRFVEEPAGLESEFRRRSSGGQSSPKVWADSYLAAFADVCGATLITFDKALAGRAERVVLLTD